MKRNKWIHREYKGQRFNLFSFTQAMDCWSLSLPAVMTCPGRVTGPDQSGNVAICDSCYACQGRQCMPSVMSNSSLRAAWVKACLHNQDGHTRTELENALVDGIVATDSQYFRWFDSGDLWSLELAYVIERVMKRTPQCNHWLPTRCWWLPRFKKVLIRMHKRRNVVVRPSALHFDVAPPVVAGMGKGSASVTSTDTPIPLCPKTSGGQGSSCATVGCRRCWSNRMTVAYLVHGPGGNHVVSTPSEKSESDRRESFKAAMSL